MSTADIKQISFGSGKREVPLKRSSKWYPSQEDAEPKKVRKSIRPTTLRPSLKPGCVLILLAGRFRGKRVVFLKALTNGILLVTGPFKVNGVPLRRVNARYVIATSTTVDLAGVNVDKFDDKYFAREKEAKKTKEEKLFKGDKVTVRCDLSTPHCSQEMKEF
ncbi:60S ribosomal protein L6 [Tricharina praecox]|uniref:60S ribosomal protein L6 n=1 Tax=Tricharina praecox TaxID=43433 RepID=UPI002220367C|nr:60S ribosomal protein L6 [Tricharina praecox]KAI5852027.1 60S ribosomal protein L6 [Tricharina praecox]